MGQGQLDTGCQLRHTTADLNEVESERIELHPFEPCLHQLAAKHIELPVR